MDSSSRSKSPQSTKISQPSMSPRDRRAYEQFAREYAEQTLQTRTALLGSAKLTRRKSRTAPTLSRPLAEAWLSVSPARRSSPRQNNHAAKLA